MHSIVGLSGSLIGIFVPAYLLTLGYAPVNIFYYFLVYGLAVFVSFFLAARISKSVGLRPIVIASFPLTLLYISLLYLLRATVFPLSLIAIVQGVGAGLYWFALHSFFMSGVKKAEKMGSKVGMLFGFPQIVGLFGPLAGGLIATRFGFSALLVTAGIAYMIAIIPLLSIPEVSIMGNLDIPTFAKLFKEFRRYTLIEFVENIREELEAVVLPLFIFLTFKSALSVGIIGTLAGVGSIIFTLLVGYYTDKINPKVFMRIGALLMVGIWIARYLSPPTQIIFYVLTLLAGFFACLIEVPFTSFVYTSAKERNPTEFIVYREFPVTLARVVVYSTAILVASIPALFLVGAGVSFLILLF